MIPDAEVHRLVRDWRFVAGYEAGLSAGLAQGYEAAQVDMDAAWRPVARFVRQMASWPTNAVVQQRRRDRSGARPVPTPAQCRASWATSQEVAS